MDTLVLHCDICTGAIENTLPKVLMHAVTLLLTDLAYSDACRNSAHGLDLTLEFEVSNASYSNLLSYFENTPWDRLKASLRHLRRHEGIQMRCVTIILRRRGAEHSEQIERLFDNALKILEKGFEDLRSEEDFLHLVRRIDS